MKVKSKEWLSHTLLELARYLSNEGIPLKQGMPFSYVRKNLRRQDL
ncbi:hypothetical protein [Cytobacillus horneckiae]|nr:hypothetical protein [Cytobacillus horneckiae]